MQGFSRELAGSQKDAEFVLQRPAGICVGEQVFDRLLMRQDLQFTTDRLPVKADGLAAAHCTNDDYKRAKQPKKAPLTPIALFHFPCSFAHESRSVTMRLKTNLPGFESFGS